MLGRAGRKSWALRDGQVDVLRKINALISNMKLSAKTQTEAQFEAIKLQVKSGGSDGDLAMGHGKKRKADEAEAAAHAAVASSAAGWALATSGGSPFGAAVVGSGGLRRSVPRVWDAACLRVRRPLRKWPLAGLTFVAGSW